MGLGLYLVGRCEASLDDPLERVERMVRHRYGEDWARQVLASVGE